MSDGMENMVRIRYGKQETGWAEKLKDGKYRIANVPLEDGLNIDDVVTCTAHADDYDTVKKVVHSPFPVKAAVYYDKIPQFHKVVKALKALGCKCEGWNKPGSNEKKKFRGTICVAAPWGVDPKAVAEKLGIMQDKK
jgi:hypothetical protein